MLFSYILIEMSARPRTQGVKRPILRILSKQCPPHPHPEDSYKDFCAWNASSTLISIYPTAKPKPRTVPSSPPLSPSSGIRITRTIRTAGPIKTSFQGTVSPISWSVKPNKHISPFLSLTFPTHFPTSSPSLRPYPLIWSNS